MILAHGLGGRADLPIPLWWAALAGAACVLASFLVLAVLWRSPRLEAERAGHPLPLLQRVVDAPTLRVALQVLGLLLFSSFLAVAWFGPDDGSRNPAPTWFYAWFWVGLVPVSLVAGPVWRAVNPLRPLAALARVALRVRRRGVPDRFADWTAEAGLLAFLWLELVSDSAASARTVAVFVTCYALLHIAAGAVCGPEWFERNDGFEVYSTLIARAAPWGRRADGALVLRSPLDGLAGTPSRPDPTAVVILLLGATAFDGLSRTTAWAGLVAGSDRTAYLGWGTVGLLGAIAAVALSYGAAMELTRRHLRAGHEAFEEFAPALIPLVIGYTVAHYFSFAVFQGRRGVLLANDPLGRGWDLFGLTEASVSGTPVSADLIAAVQVGAIVTGHVVAAICAHDRALGLLAQRHQRWGQVPLLVVMVGYTAAGITLLAGA